MNRQLLRNQLLLAGTLFALLLHADAQLPPTHWAYQYGGSNADIPYSIKNTTDGGTIAVGYTSSKDGDVSPQANREYWDLWVVKLDACGIIQWEKSAGGTGYETARDIIQLPDGGYLVAGETNSTDGGVVSGYGGTKDIWLLKLDANGTIMWQKRYGGSGLDMANHLTLLNDGSVLLAGSSTSNDGDIRGNHSTGTFTDGVLMKLSAAGTILWSRCYGGTRNEEFFDAEYINGVLYAAGFTNSVDGDIPPNQKNYDMWLLAIDGNGQKVFSKIYGGSQNDVCYSMCRGMDNSLTLAGYTTSADGDVTVAHGSQDYWVINTDLRGKLNWQRSLGGTDAEYARAVLTDKDSNYIVGGISYSRDGDITAPRGEGDFWLVKLDRAGRNVWTSSRGGSGNDHLRSMLYIPGRDEYYLGGDAASGDGDFSNANGDADFALIKLKLPARITIDTMVCNPAAFIPFTDTLTDRCGYDSAIATYRPVALRGPFDSLRRADTIFAGQSTTLHAQGNGTITWQAHSTLSCTDCTDPVARPLVTTRYTATHRLPEGCQVSDQFLVVVLKDALVQVPTGFTPNGDGLNDLFGPIGKVPDGYRLRVFDRNGTVIFQSTTFSSRWNGMIDGRLQPSGIFLYMIEYRDLQQQPHLAKGTFALIR